MYVGNTKDTDLIPGSGRSLRGGNGNLLQYSCLESSMDSRAWQAIVSPWGHKESDVTEQISIYIFHCIYVPNPHSLSVLVDFFFRHVFLQDFLIYDLLKSTVFHVNRYYSRVFG